MTTHLPSQQTATASGASNYVPHTPPITDADLERYGVGQHNGQQTTSPLASPKGMRRDLSYANPPKSVEGIEKKKRKYSACIYKWTQVMWEHARQDIERRASVSSTDSDATGNSFSPNENDDAKAPTRSRGNEHDISSVPALH
ncbi:hypothetical protein I316_03653 [Kwoniella heveanensis BCC8398]|uniref:Uncharacterized protein n=1 Tax=Kwoniella heveanensis BCC8398 TaxID=1296120 RepID=A0A1B9GUD0_9TREE|nr:hypothetical protein I316_03653 [Kwoniella heveanensis BCC8398]